MSALAGACHCGAVTLAVPGRPDFANACNCTACAKLGTLWGYYAAAEVRIDGAPRPYVRADKANPRLSFNFCPTCGATTHWALLDPAGERIGVNLRLFEPADLAGTELIFGDRRNWDTADERHYYRPPATLDDAGAAR